MVYINVVSSDVRDETYAMDWLLSDSQSFDNILAVSTADSNVNFKAFNYHLEAGVKYYVCARPLLKDKGYGEFSNIVEVVAENTTIIDDVMPSFIKIGHIRTDSDIKNHSRYNFKLFLDDVTYVTSAIPDSILVVISDINGKIIHTVQISGVDEVMRDGLAIKDCVLPDNTIVKFDITLKLGSNDVSDVYTLVVKTAADAGRILRMNGVLDSSVDLTINAISSGSNSTYRWIIYSNSDMSVSYFDKTTTTPNVVVPANTMLGKEFYIIVLITDSDNGVSTKAVYTL
jgi:hypothetical protein